MCGLGSPGDCLGDVGGAVGGVVGDVVGGVVGGPVDAAVDGVADSVIGKIADAVTGAVGDGLASLGTLWINVDTPNLSEGTSTGRNAGETPPGSAGIEQVLSYVTWVGLAVCVLSLMAAGVKVATKSRRGSYDETTARVGMVLVATIVVSGSAAIVGGLFKAGRVGQASETVGFLQNSLWFYAMGLAVLSVIVAGVKMAWEQRSQPGRDVLKSLLTLILITGAGLPVLGILVDASDGFSEWIITSALDCDPTVGDGSCFGDSLGTMIALGSTSTGNPTITAPFMVIVLGLIALLTSLVQIMLMIARAGMLVILAGILPLTAAATNTEMGQAWFKKALSWLVAWLLYKPAAAIVYATAFHLTGSDVFGDDGLTTVLTGLMLMIMAVVALPALMRFVTPAVGAMAAGSSGAMTMAMAAVPATGAVSALGRLGSSGVDAGHQQPSGAGPSGSQGSQGTAGGQGPSGAGMSGRSGPGGSGTGGGMPSGSQGPSKAPAVGGQAATTGSAGGAAGGAAGGGSAAGGAAAGGAAAAGPAGAALMVADGAKRAGQAAAEVAGSAAEGATQSSDERAGNHDGGSA